MLVVGAAARVTWVTLEGKAPRFASDPEAYLLQGETIARGEGYANPLVDIENAIRRQRHEVPLAAEPASFYPPGFPMFVAAVTWTVWHTPIPDSDLVRTIEYLQALLGTLTILFVFLLARRVFDAQVALLAAAIVALYPNLIATTATLQFETTFITLLLGTVLVVLPAATGDDHGRVRLVASGALIGAVALIHPTVILLIFAFLACRVTLRRPWRETVRDLSILTVCIVLVIAPWTIRNAVRLHAFVPIATGAGPALCQSRNSESKGGIDLGVLDRQCAPKHTASSFAKQEVAVNSYATSHAIRWVLGHPTAELQMWWRRTDLAYRVDTSGLYAPTLAGNARRNVTTVANVASFVVLAIAVFGAGLMLAKRRHPAGVFLIVATIAFAAVPIMLFGDPRYRVPAEPLFAVFAAAALGAAMRARRIRRLGAAS
jgi:asparagine N-glycosylation enzyme membrane subunit Stt3